MTILTLNFSIINETLCQLLSFFHLSIDNISIINLIFNNLSIVVDLALPIVYLANNMALERVGKGKILGGLGSLG